MHSDLKLPSVVFQMPVCSTPVLTEAPARTEVVTLNASVCRRMKETSVRPVSSLLLFMDVTYDGNQPEVSKQK